MLLSPRKNGLDSLFKEVRVFKETHLNLHSPVRVGPEGGRPWRGGTNLVVFVPIWPVMRMPG